MNKVISYPQVMPAFMCPACRLFHEFSTVPNNLGGVWTWNYNEYLPSIDQTVITKVGNPATGVGWTCEAWVQDGMVSFLELTTHLLHGTTHQLQSGV